MSRATALAGLFTARTATVLITVFLALLAGFWVDHAPNVGGDTPGLVTGAEVLRTCIDQSQFTSCGVPPNGAKAYDTPYPTFTAVAPYPLLQYIPATVLLAAGASPAQVLTALSLLSVASFFLLLWMLWRASARSGSRAWGPALALVVLTSPLLFYAYSTFGEMTAAMLLAAVVAAAAGGRRGWLIAIMALLAGITKETSPPFTFAFGALAVVISRPRADRAAALLWLGGGSIAAVIANAAFNVFRYGGVENRDYLQSGFQVHGIPALAGRFAALLVAPNGGIFLFWAAAMLILVAGVVYGVKGGPEDARRWPMAALGVVFLLVLVGLSMWWSPFGWNTWGPRLTLPWIPPMLLLAVLGTGRHMLPALRRATSTIPALLTTAVVATLLALPQVGVLFDSAAASSIFVPDSICAPEGVPGSPQSNRCFDHQAWERHMVLISALDGDVHPPGLLFSLALLLAAVGLLVLAREHLVEAPSALAAASSAAEFRARYPS